MKMTIYIEGVVYDLDVEDAKRKGVLTPKRIGTSGYKVGDRFVDVTSRESGPYILANSDSNKLILINMKTGGMWNPGVVVKDFKDVTWEEWDQITAFDTDIVKQTNG